MGFAVCRFYTDEGCAHTGNQEWRVELPDVGRVINVPSMWRHYALDHLVQPTIEEREIIMSADSSQSKGVLISTRGFFNPVELKVFYVERLGLNKYTHNIGEKPDIEFVEKLESILSNARPLSY